MRPIYIIWPVSVIAAGISGWYLGQPGAEQPPGVKADTSVRHEETARIQAGAHLGEPPRESTIRDSLIAAIREARPGDRLTEVVQLLERMTPDNVDEFRAAWESSLADGKPETLVGTMFDQRMGEVMGTRILMERTGNPWDFRVIGAINEQLAGAMRTDPQGVRAWYDSLTNEDFREAMLGGYTGALAAADRPAAMKLMGTVPAEFRSRCAEAIVGAVRRNEGTSGLAEWLRTTLSAPENADAPWLADVLSHSVRQAAQTRQSASRAAEILVEHADKPYADLSFAPEIASKYAAYKPMEALDWAGKIESSGQYPEPGQLLAAVISIVPDSDVSATTEWCASHTSGASRELAIQILQSRVAGLEPGLAARAAEQLAALRGDSAQ